MDFFNEHAEIAKTRHKLPHWQQGRVPVFITFRLADSLPQSVLEPLLSTRDSFLRLHPKPWDEATEKEFHRQFSMRLDEYLDAGHGSCALRDLRAAKIVSERLHHFDAQRYDLFSYVVMPNHAHVLFTPYESKSLPEIVQAWKGVSSRMIHKAGISTLDSFWQPDYFDRLIRSPQHFAKVQKYIAENPAKAFLKPGDYVLWEQRSAETLLRLSPF